MAAAPSHLTYKLDVRLAVGRSLELAPTLDGTASHFAIAPALPEGLSLDADSGVISGTPKRATRSATYAVTASNAQGSDTFQLSFGVDPATLHIVAAVTEPDADELRYRWKTDVGQLDTTSGTSVNWTLPEGRGLHFLYLLASDGRGGYTERRIAVSSDDLSVATSIPGPERLPVAPAVANTPGGIYRSWIGIFPTPPAAETPWRVYYVPDAKVFLSKTTGSQPPATTPAPDSAIVSTNLLGEFVIPKLPVADYDTYCSLDGGASFRRCSPTAFSNGVGAVAAPRAVTNYRYSDAIEGADTNTIAFVVGNVQLADGSRCGILNPYFGLEVAGTAELLDASDARIAGPTRINAYGDYLFQVPVSAPQQVKVRIRCENAKAVDLAVTRNPQTAPTTVVHATISNRAPVIGSITASLGDKVIAGGPIPPPGTAPSDQLPESFRFLATKGIDTRESACAYYKSIGAASGCNADGNLVDAISFDQWKRAHAMEPYNTALEYTATYVNVVDLNLTRRHHGTQSDANHAAFYVCNHLGPRDDSQAEVDRVIEDANAERNLVACVAMDYSITKGVNDDKPFIKFHIFGADGKLASSINLDGRGEKFVPGTCVACHGGDHYAGAYPADGSGAAEIGAHYLPYDLDNFRFSSHQGLTRTEQQPNLRQLNSLLLSTSPTPAVAALVKGWYKTGSDAPDEDYVPPSWVDASTDPNTRTGVRPAELYRTLVKPNCRTCHVAFEARFDFDASYADNFQSLPTTVGGPVCNGENDPEFRRNHTMPNSKVTFDRMWAQRGTQTDPFPQFEAAMANGIMCRAPAPAALWP